MTATWTRTARPEAGDSIDAVALGAWLTGDHPHRDDPMVLDVRSAAEYEAAHIRGSYHAPLATLAEHTDDLAAHLDDPVVLVCQSGIRAEQARRHLTVVGLDRAYVLEGGLPAYIAAGGEVVVGRRGWALERQVRLLAGALVLVGLAAGRFLTPQARLLTAGVGAGLTFSALSNTCAMGAALSQLPCNRAITEPGAADTLAALQTKQGGRQR